MPPGGAHLLDEDQVVDRALLPVLYPLGLLSPVRLVGVADGEEEDGGEAGLRDHRQKVIVEAEDVGPAGFAGPEAELRECQLTCWERQRAHPLCVTVNAIGD